MSAVVTGCTTKGKKMAKFKQVSQPFLFGKVMGFWGNMVKNYDGNVRNDDFFNVISRNFDHDRAVELIEAAYSKKALDDMKKARSRDCRLDLSDSLDSIFLSLWNTDKANAKCRIILEGIKDCIDGEKQGGDEDPLEKRFAELKRLLRLSDLESEILLLAYVKYETCLVWPRRVESREKPLFYAMALDRSFSEISRVMTAKGKLRKFNLLDGDWDFNGRTLGGYIDGTAADAIERQFYRKSEETDILPWAYYGELAKKDGETIKRMLQVCKGRLNILLYGAPGTGKTSFARTLAKEMGLQTYEIRQGDEDGKNMNASARMVGIQIAQEQEDPKSSLVIVDEADELLRSGSGGFSFFGVPVGGRRSTEKGVMNTILDDVKIPTVWISNAAAEEMDESVRRRFDYSVCFERLNMTQRISIWKNLVAKHELGDLIPVAKTEAFAARYATSAGGISTVLANVKRMKPKAENVDELVAKLMKPHCQLMGITASDKFLPAKDYSLDGLNIRGKVKPDKMVKAVRNYLDADFNEASEDKPRMNILLYGAPGTGKSEFCKYLGKALDRKVLAVKGSDLLSKWVGGSEQNIARAFRRAEAERAILFFDEVDGLVQSREMAEQSWQVSQVNELLQQMENFDGVMVAATNFCKNLDLAIMRRFTFKMEFDYLDDEGKRLFFERMFKTRLTEEEFAELKTLQNLAPGDFRTVRQEQFYLADEQTNWDRIEALKEECAVKKDGNKTARIGFAA